MPSLDGPNKLRLGSCWYRAFILAVPSEYIQTSGGPPSMSFPLNSRGAWGGGRGDFRSELRTRAISRSPPRQFLRVTTDFLAVFPSLLSNYLVDAKAHRSRRPTRGLTGVKDTPRPHRHDYGRTAYETSRSGSKSSIELKLTQLFLSSRGAAPR